MIPKVIHYCWFGRNPLPEKARECIASWKKYFPDYEIKEWNEDNFDINACAYTREAYEAKKWAFVSDYARFKILYEQGGLYFDTDVEVIKPFDDILNKGSFMGFEKGEPTAYGNDYGVNPGLGIAAEPGLPVYKEILIHYHSIRFLLEDGTQNTSTIVTYTTEVLTQHGLKNMAEIQQIAGVRVYPPAYFCPLDFHNGKLNITEETHSIHHYVASWFTKWDWALVHIGRLFSGKGMLMFRFGQLVALPVRLLRKIKSIGFVPAIKLAMQKCRKGRGAE